MVAKFFERRIRHVEGPKARQPFVMDEWQRDDLDLIYEVDRRGERVWRKILWGQARGNGKTPVTGGIGLLELASHRDSPKIFAASGKKDQAKLLLNFVKPSVEAGPLRDHMQVQAWSVLMPRWAGVLRILAADGDLEHGLNVSCALIDELHVFKTQKQEELYWALSTALKRPYSWEISITTAGWEKATLLGEKYDAALLWPDVWVSKDKCLTIARNRASHQLMIWRGLPAEADPSDEALWRAVNPASWVDLAYLRMQAASLPSNVFRRLHLNQWTESEDSVFDAKQWDSCCDPAAAVIPDGADVWLAVDVGERSDTSAVVAVSPRADGRFSVQSRVFEPREDGKSLLPMIEAYIRECCDRWQHRSLAYDPWQFRRSAELLRSEGVRLYRAPRSKTTGFPQSDSFMCPASQLLFDAVKDGQIAHDGDRVLRRHMLSVEAEQTSRGGWRLVKPLKPHGRRVDSSKKVDSAIGLAMALTAAADAPPEPWFI